MDRTIHVVTITAYPESAIPAVGHAKRMNWTLA